VHASRLPSGEKGKTLLKEVNNNNETASIRPSRLLMFLFWLMKIIPRSHRYISKCKLQGKHHEKETTTANVF